MTDYKEEQANEIEALQSIYPDEYTEISQSPWEFQIAVCPESSDDDDEADRVSVNLQFKFGPTYPEVEPEITVASSENISEEDVEALLELLTQTTSENLGMVMVFTLVSAVQDYLTEKRDAAREKQRKEREEQEEAARKAAEAPVFSGTPVTVETFTVWKKKFMAEKLQGRTHTDDSQGKLTGRQLFERDASLSQSDMRFLQDFEDDVELEGSEPAEVVVDESLFQDVGDLELDDDDLN